MKNNKHSSLNSSLLRYISFSVLSMIGLSCYILADTFFVANGIGNDGLTALNIVLMLLALCLVWVVQPNIPSPLVKKTIN